MHIKAYLVTTFFYLLFLTQYAHVDSSHSHAIKLSAAIFLQLPFQALTNRRFLSRLSPSCGYKTVLIRHGLILSLSFF